MSAPPQPSPSRRHDLDWIRVGAFGLLILYHVGLVYGFYDWHIRSVHRFDWMREGVLITNPWRLALLFLVSGAALRFMTARRTPKQVMRARLERLVPPLVFGVLILVTLQSWVEAMDKAGWADGYLAWLGREFSVPGILDGVPVNHLWFVIYIAVYSAAVVALMNRPDWIARAETFLETHLSGWRLLVWPVVYLATIRILLFPIFGLTNNLTWDWYNHFLSGGAFLFGYLIVGRETIWRDLERFRWVGVGVAVVALPIMMLQVAHPGGGAFLGAPRNLVIAIDQWAVISAVLGFGSRHLRHAGGPTLRYLTDAVFTCYLAHQTILVGSVWLIRPYELPPALEALILATVTLGGSLLVYEVVRHIRFLRPIWGLKPLSPHERAGAAPQPSTTGHLKRRRLLLLGVVAPVVALFAVLVASAAYPGFDNARQYLSELGGETARLPLIFNAGVFVAGALTIATGVGFGLAVLALTGQRLTAVFTGLLFALAGVGLMGSVLYPWPDPRHMVINLGLGIQLAPLLLLWGLPRRELPRLSLFLGGVFVLMAFLTLCTKHLIWPGMVNPANVGWWERAYAVVLVGWVGVAAWVLERRLRPTDGAERPDASG